MKWAMWGIGIVVFVLCFWIVFRFLNAIDEVGLKGILEELWYGKENI